MADSSEAVADDHDRARKQLQSYLNKRMRISISDGRIVDGMFLCTDRDCNIVLANCEEFLSQEELDESERYLSEKEGGCHKQPRTLSLAIVPGGHIRSICIAGDHQKTTPTNPDREDTCTDHTQSTRQSHDIIGQSHDTEEQSHDIRRCLA